MQHDLKSTDGPLLLSTLQMTHSIRRSAKLDQAPTFQHPIGQGGWSVTSRNKGTVMIDARYDVRAITPAGGEDRALLRSNPSARAGAETCAEPARTVGSRLPKHVLATRRKTLGFGARAQETDQRGGTYVNFCGTGDFGSLVCVARPPYGPPC